MRTTFWLGAAVTLSVFASCAGGTGGPPAPVPTTSYTRDIQPLVERSCVSCHQAGGIGPFSMTSYQDVQLHAGEAYDAINAGRMPPFFASADCNSYEGDFRFTEAEKALFKTWLDERSPQGTEAEAQHAPVPTPPQVRHDRVMGFEGDYDFRLDGGTDNYRCFALDPGNTEDVQVTGYELLVDNVPVLHHMLAYSVSPDEVAQLQALDDADPGQGYTCFSGGIGIPKAIQNQVAGWVPGSAATKLPEGTGLVLRAHSKIVMQIHYNTAALFREGTPHVDHTHLALEFAPMGTLTPAQILPMLDHNLNIPANNPASVQTATLPARLFAGNSGTIYRAMGHMHKLGTRVRTDVVHTDGSTQCLVDEPGWDFNWQRDYTLKNPIHLQPGDSLRITCTYDNSAANQAYLNGVQLTPRDVSWGESSFDEMCMTYMTFTK